MLPLCGSELNAPWPAKREKSLVPNVLENQEFGPEIKKPTFPSSSPLTPARQRFELGNVAWSADMAAQARRHQISAIVIAQRTLMTKSIEERRSS